MQTVEQCKVLIVDDNPDNVELLATVLGQRYRIVTCGQSNKVLEMVHTESPDLVLLDVMMPGLSGFDVCVSIKLDPHTAHIPVIFLTAKTDMESLATGFDVGGADYITKPFRITEIVARVSTHLKLKKSIDEKIELLKEKEDLIDKLQIALKEINRLKKAQSNEYERPSIEQLEAPRPQN